MHSAHSLSTTPRFVHTRSSAPKRFAKFGWQTRTFCHKKVGKEVAKLESDSFCHKKVEKVVAKLESDNYIVLLNKTLRGMYVDAVQVSVV